MAQILFLAHRIPWPADRGDKIRSHHILKHLAQMAPVHVGAFADDERDMDFAMDMSATVADCHIELRKKPQWRAGIEALATGKPVSLTSFGSDTMQTWVDGRIATGQISHIFVFSGQMAQYIPADFAGRIVMDFVDVDSAKFESYAHEGNPFMRWINAREGRVLSSFEHHAAALADMSVLVSDAEADLFRTRSGVGRDKVLALGNGIDTAYFNPDIAVAPVTRDGAGPLIVFTGQMDYRPNVEAVFDFATNAMPVITQTHPLARFAIVGRNPTQTVTALGDRNGVIVTGAVDDVRGWLNAADVIVAPLRIARGIQNKVLEAMAMAKPVVASTAAAQGIDAQGGVHFYIADNVAEEAARVIDLLHNPAAGVLLGQAARRHVSQHYSWAGQLSGLDDIMGLAR
jgi:polysaccharide biosynthesis protein PslH